MTSSDSFSEEKLESLENIKRLYRHVADLAKRLDGVVKQASCWEDLFNPENNLLRIRLKDCCERLMFYDPLSHGKKVEDLLWRKIFYDVVIVAKKLQKQTSRSSASTDALSLRNHLIMGTGTYHHLLFRLQSEFGIAEGAADFLQLSNAMSSKNGRNQRSSQRKENVDPRKKEWAISAFQRCLICLGDLARYKQDLFENHGAELAERYYSQAAAFHPINGMPHNQQGTLSGLNHYGCDAAYHYMRCLLSSQTFEGSEGNLERVFDRARKLLNQVSQEQQRFVDSNNADTVHRETFRKQCLTRFLLFCSACFFEDRQPSTVQLEQLCQEVLYDLYNYMQLLLQEKPTDQKVSEDGMIVFRIIIMALMCVHRLTIKDRSNQSAAIAFTLALFSHLLQHIIIKLQKALGVNINKGPSAKLIMSQASKANCTKPTNDQVNDPKFQQISCIGKTAPRRRRKINCSARDDSDLSEDGHSDAAGTDSEGGHPHSDVSEDGGEGSSTDDEVQGHSQNPAALHQHCELNGTAMDGLVSHRSSKDKQGHHASDYHDAKNKIKNKSLKHFPKGKSTGQHTSATPSRVLAVVEGEILLSAVKICADWILCHPNLFTACAQGSQLLWSRLAALLNLICPVLQIETNGALCSEGTMLQQLQLFNMCHGDAVWTQKWPLPEDVMLRDFPLLTDTQEQLLFSNVHDLWLTNSERAILRVACLHQFGIVVSRYTHTNLMYDSALHVFKKTDGEEEWSGVLLPMADGNLKEAVDVQRKQLMENMAHLWLQAEVTELETKVKLSNIPQLSPYVVVTTAVLIDHLPVLRLLLYSKRFIVVIPSCVIQHLDLLKKESLQARDVIRWLELEFQRGNRYLRAQQQHEHASLSPMKYPKRKDKDIWDFFQIVECCHHLAQQGTSSNASSLVTLLVGERDQMKQLANKSSWNLDVIVESAGIKMDNIENFLAQWKDASKNQR